MVIVSGSIGKEEVHYKAPPSDIVPKEMKQFIAWYNAFVIESHNIKESLIKTAIAHLYFETIHPYEDGNGRIGRAIAEKCLSESLGRPLVLSIRSEEHTSELQSRGHLVCRLLLEKKKTSNTIKQNHNCKNVQP